MTSPSPLTKMITFLVVFLGLFFFCAVLSAFFMSEVYRDRLSRAVVASHQASVASHQANEELRVATADYLINCLTSSASSGPPVVDSYIRLVQQIAQEIAPLVQVQHLTIPDYKTINVSQLTYSIIFTLSLTLPQSEGRCQSRRLDRLPQPRTKRT